MLPQEGLEENEEDTAKEEQAEEQQHEQKEMDSKNRKEATPGTLLRRGQPSRCLPREERTIRNVISEMDVAKRSNGPRRNPALFGS